MPINFLLASSFDSNQNPIDPIPVLLVSGNPKFYFGPFNEFDNLNRLRLGYRTDIGSNTNYFLVPYHRIAQLVDSGVWSNIQQRMFIFVRHFNEVTGEWETLLSTNSLICDAFRLDFNTPTESLALLECPSVSGTRPKFKALSNLNTGLRFNFETSSGTSFYSQFDHTDDDYLLGILSVYVNGRTTTIYRNPSTNPGSSLNVWGPPSRINLDFSNPQTRLASLGSTEVSTLPHDRYKYKIRNLVYPSSLSQQIMPVFYLYVPPILTAKHDYPLQNYIDGPPSSRWYVGAYSSTFQNHLVSDSGNKETLEERTEWLFRDEGHSEYLITSFTPTDPEQPKDPFHAHTVDITPEGTRLSFTTGKDYFQPLFRYPSIHGISNTQAFFFSPPSSALVGPVESSLTTEVQYHPEGLTASLDRLKSPYYSASKTRRPICFKPNIQAPIFFQNRKVSALNFEILDQTLPKINDTEDHNGYVWTITDIKPLPYLTGHIVANYLNHPFNVGGVPFPLSSALSPFMSQLKREETWYFGLCTDLVSLYNGLHNVTIQYNTFGPITFGNTNPYEAYQQGAYSNITDSAYIPTFLSQAKHINFGESEINRTLKYFSGFATYEIEEVNTPNQTLYNCLFRIILTQFPDTVPVGKFFDFRTTIRVTPELA